MATLRRGSWKEPPSKASPRTNCSLEPPQSTNTHIPSPKAVKVWRAWEQESEPWHWLSPISPGAALKSWGDPARRMLQTWVHLCRTAGLQLVASLGNLPLAAVTCGALSLVCDDLRQLVGGSGGGVSVDAAGPLQRLLSASQKLLPSRLHSLQQWAPRCLGTKPSASPLSSSRQ